MLADMPITSQKLSSVDFIDEMQKSYLDYANHIIHHRAIASIYDGQKKVQRRILFSMYSSGFTYSGRFIKSARITGNTSGTLHPHGEVAIYECLVRYVQNFTIYLPLILGQGNYGSIDGDAPGAQRYTEAKLTKVSTMLLNDLKYDTVPMMDNYDASTKEPEYLPVKLPLSIINGSTGIAVGFITFIPSHNTNEIIDACLFMLQQPDINQVKYDDIKHIIKGPDFPVTCLVDNSDLDNIYRNGRGNLITASIITNNENTIYIKGLPYGVKKMTMIKSIANAVKEGNITNIEDIRDESKGENYVVEISVKEDAHIPSIIKRLYKYTMCSNTNCCEFRMTNGKTSEIYSLDSILREFIKMRMNVIKRRLMYQNNQLISQIERNIALFIANSTNETLNIISKIINSMSVSESREELKKYTFDISNIVSVLPSQMQKMNHKQFKLTNMQIEFLLSTPLSRINKGRIGNIHESISKNSSEIKNNEKTINDENELKKVIIEEINELKPLVKRKRVCQIKKLDRKIHYRSLDPSVELIAVLYNDGYIDLKPSDNYKVQKRGGKGKQICGYNIISDILQVTSHDDVILYTIKGHIYKINLFDIFYAGKTINALINVKEDDRIIKIQKQSNMDRHQNIIVVTKLGLIKKHSIKHIHSLNRNGKKICNLSENDSIVSILYANTGDKMVLFSNVGKYVTINVDEIRNFNSGNTKGVKGIKLKNEHFIVAATCINEYDLGIIITNNHGKIKSMDTSVFLNRVTKRNLVGSRCTGKDMIVTSCVRKTSEDETISLVTKNNRMIYIKASSIPAQNRYNKGVKAIDMEEGDLIICAFKLAP